MSYWVGCRKAPSIHTRVENKRHDQLPSHTQAHAHAHASYIFTYIPKCILFIYIYIYVYRCTNIDTWSAEVKFVKNLTGKELCTGLVIIMKERKASFQKQIAHCCRISDWRHMVRTVASQSSKFLFHLSLAKVIKIRWNQSYISTQILLAWKFVYYFFPTLAAKYLYIGKNRHLNIYTVSIKIYYK